MTKLCDITDANTLAEREYNSGYCGDLDDGEWDSCGELSSGEALAAIAARNTFAMCPEAEKRFEAKRQENFRLVELQLNLMFRKYL